METYISTMGYKQFNRFRIIGCSRTFCKFSEDGDNGPKPNDMVLSDDELSDNNKEEKKKKAIKKYYEKWKNIYGVDVSNLSAFVIQKRCIEKYEICCDIARYYFINDNWKKSKKWFNRANIWYLRIDQKNLMSQKNLHFNQMISDKRYQWDKIVNIIKVLNVILNVNQNKIDNDNDIKHNLYECCQRIIDGTKNNKNESVQQFEKKLYQILLDICNNNKCLESLSWSLLNVWLTEMKYFCKNTESLGYLQIFVIIYSMFNKCSNHNDKESNLNDDYHFFLIQNNEQRYFKQIQIDSNMH